MDVRITPIHFKLAAIAAICCCAALTARADTTEYNATPTQSAPIIQSSGPSANNDAFRKLRMQCETDVPAGKANGDICAQAAALLVGADVPDEYRELSEELRVKFALRLLERGVDSSNIARARAFDWYNKTGFLGIAVYADSLRAKELMDMMIKSGYPGGILRKVRGSTSILALTTTEAEKREGCTLAKKMLAEGKLDPDNVSVAKDVAGSMICTSYEPAKQ